MSSAVLLCSFTFVTRHGSPLNAAIAPAAGKPRVERCGPRLAHKRYAPPEMNGHQLSSRFSSACSYGGERAG